MIIRPGSKLRSKSRGEYPSNSLIPFDKYFEILHVGSNFKGATIKLRGANLTLGEPTIRTYFITPDEPLIYLTTPEIILNPNIKIL